MQMCVKYWESGVKKMEKILGTSFMYELLSTFLPFCQFSYILVSEHVHDLLCLSSFESIFLFSSSVFNFCYSVKAVWPCGQIMQGKEIRKLSALFFLIFWQLLRQFFLLLFCQDYTQVERY